MSVNRCYSEKKNGFDVEARSLFSSLHDLLEIKNLTRCALSLPLRRRGTCT